MTERRFTEHTPRRMGFVVAFAALLALIAAVLPSSTAYSSAAKKHSQPKPTIVLVHGAFADASGWDAVAKRLQHRGYTVSAGEPAARPDGRRGVRQVFLDTLPRPDRPRRPLLRRRGHHQRRHRQRQRQSAGLHRRLCARRGRDGRCRERARRSPGASRCCSPTSVPRPFPGGAPDNPDVYINPAASVRCSPPTCRPRRPRSWRPASAPLRSPPSALRPVRRPGRRSRPGIIVASQDHTIPPTAERVMAARANAHTIEINSSHVAMISHPAVTTRLILRAATSG